MSRLRSAFWSAVAVVLLTSAPAPLVAAAGQAAGQTSDEGDLKRLIRLAEQGDPEAQFWLGRIYEDGVGVERDYKEALNWYRRAANLAGC